MAWEMYGECILDEDKLRGFSVSSPVHDTSQNVVTRLSYRAAVLALATTLSLMSLSPSEVAWASENIPGIIAAASEKPSLDDEIESILKGDSSDKKSEGASGSVATGDGSSSGAGTSAGVEPGAGEGSAAEGAGTPAETPSGAPGEAGEAADSELAPNDPNDPNDPEASEDAFALTAMALAEGEPGEALFSVMAVNPNAVTSEDELIEAIEYNGGSGTITLADNIQLTGSVTVPESAALTINFNGFTIKSAAGAAPFRMMSESGLSLTGSGSLDASGSPAIATNASSTGGSAEITQAGPSVVAKTLFTSSVNWSYSVNTGSLTLSQTVTMGNGAQFNLMNANATFTSTASSYAVVLDGVATFNMSGHMTTAHNSIQVNNADAMTIIGTSGKLTTTTGNSITCTTDIKQVAFQKKGTVIALNGKVFVVEGNVSPSINAAEGALVSDTSIMDYLPSVRKMVYNPSTSATPYTFNTLNNLTAKGYAGVVNGVYCMTATDFDELWAEWPDAEVEGVECAVTFYDEDGSTIAKKIEIFRGHCIGGTHSNLPGVDVSAPTDAEMAAKGGPESTFTGWMAPDGTVYTSAQLATLPINSNMSFVAQYKDSFQRFTVTLAYGLNGGSTMQRIVKEGSAVVFPTADDVPSGGAGGEAGDYVLEGWYTAPAGADGTGGGGTKVAGADGVVVAGTAAASVTANATYYAHYKYVGTYDVTFSYSLTTDASSLGVSVPASSVAKVKDGAKIGSAQVPTPPSLNRCEFVGWYLADAAGKPTGSALTAAQVADVVVNGAVKYVGVYDRATYNVTFSYSLTPDAAATGAATPTGSVVQVKASKKINNTEGAAVPTPPTLTGCVFSGWYLADAAGKPTGSALTAEEVANASVNAAKGYVGVYDVATYNVTFSYSLGADAAGLGVVAPGSSSVAVKGGKTLAAAGGAVPSAPTLDRCTFAGWYLADSAGKPTGSALSAAAIAATVVGGDVRYVGVYEAATYNVIFAYSLDADAAALGVVAPGSSSVAVKAGKTLAAAGGAVPSAPSLDRCVFKGWYLADSAGKPTGSALSAAAIGAAMVNGAVKYVGVYDAATYTVTFSYVAVHGDGSAAPDIALPASSSVSVKAGKTVGDAVPAAAEVEDCRFMGWRDSAGKSVNPANTVVNGDVSFVGRYRVLSDEHPDPVLCEVDFRWGGAYAGADGDEGTQAKMTRETVEQGHCLDVESMAPDSAAVAVPGYRFVGWFDAVGNQLDSQTPIMDHCVYTARYEKLPTPGVGGNGSTAPSDGRPTTPFQQSMPLTMAALSAAGINLPGVRRGLADAEYPEDELPNEAVAGAGGEFGEGDDDIWLHKSLEEGGEGADGSIFDDVPFNAADVATTLALASGTALAAFIVARVGSFMGANAASAGRARRGRRARGRKPPVT